MQTILSNISQVAAMAIIVAAVGGFFVAVVGSALGHPVNADALAMVNTLVNVLIGLAIGAGAGLAVGTTRTLRAFEMQAQAQTNALNAKSK